MTDLHAVHRRWTPVRAAAYEKLFGGKPIEVHPYHRFAPAEETCLIDVFVYHMAVEGRDRPIEIAVTNGMSDFPMREEGMPRRRELIQYFVACDDRFARGLHQAAWLPHFDDFTLSHLHTIQWPDKIAGDLQHSFLLGPIVYEHADFSVSIDGDPATFLWHVYLTAAEHAVKTTRGPNVLLDRMDEVNMPWILDPNNRPPLFPNDT